MYRSAVNGVPCLVTHTVPVTEFQPCCDGSSFVAVVQHMSESGCKKLFRKNQIYFSGSRSVVNNQPSVLNNIQQIQLPPGSWLSTNTGKGVQFFKQV